MWDQSYLSKKTIFVFEPSTWGLLNKLFGKLHSRSSPSVVLLESSSCRGNKMVKPNKPLAASSGCISVSRLIFGLMGSRLYFVGKKTCYYSWGKKIRKLTKSSFSQMICLLDRILEYIIWDGGSLQYKENTAFSKKLQPERWCGPHSDVATATALPVCGGTYDNLKSHAWFIMPVSVLQIKMYRCDCEFLKYFRANPRHRASLCM